MSRYVDTRVANIRVSCACIQSFSCPSLNEPLDKRMALVLLGELVPRT